MPDDDQPMSRFQRWFEQARAKERADPTAMSLATIGRDGRPEVRMVLLKGADPRGFVFYTNLESPKAASLRRDPRASLCLHWAESQRQVRAEGNVEPVTDAESDAYFATRPRLSQIGAWASRQSQPMEGRFELEQAVAREALRFPIGPVPRPPYWGGFRLVPNMVEFWHARPFRHHDRERFVLNGGKWTGTWLFP